MLSAARARRVSLFMLCVGVCLLLLCHIPRVQSSSEDDPEQSKVAANKKGRSKHEHGTLTSVVISSNGEATTITSTPPTATEEVRVGDDEQEGGTADVIRPELFRDGVRIMGSDGASFSSVNLTGLLHAIKNTFEENFGMDLEIEHEAQIEDVWREGKNKAEVEGGAGAAALDSLGILNSLSEEALQSIRDLNDHAVEDSDAERLERMLAAFQELPMEERERMGLEEIERLTDPAARLAALEVLWTRRQQELKDVYEAMLKPNELLQATIDVLRQSRSQSRLVVDGLTDPVDSSDMPTGGGGAGAGQELGRAVTEDDVMDTLYKLEDYLTDLDMTRDFRVMGGWPLLVERLQPLYDMKEREMAAWIIGTAVKNTPAYQEWLLEGEARALRQLVDILTDDQSSSGLLAKTLYALSAALQHNRQLQKAFHEMNGIDALARCVSDNGNGAADDEALKLKLKLKIATLCSDLVYQEATSAEVPSPGQLTVTSPYLLAYDAAAPETALLLCGLLNDLLMQQAIAHGLDNDDVKDDVADDDGGNGGASGSMESRSGELSGTKTRAHKQAAKAPMHYDDGVSMMRRAAQLEKVLMAVEGLVDVCSDVFLSDSEGKTVKTVTLVDKLESYYKTIDTTAIFKNTGAEGEDETGSGGDGLDAELRDDVLRLFQRIKGKIYAQ